MGLGKLLTRSTVYTATDTITGAAQTFTVVDNIAPDWTASSAYRGGMSVPGAWRAALLLAGLLAQVPWDGYRKFIGEPEELIEPRPALLEQPNPPRTRFTTLNSAMLDYLWHGNALWVIAAKNAGGWPTAVVPVPAQLVGVRQVTPYVDSPLPVGSLEYKIGRLTLGPNDVIHVMGPCEPGGLRGLGVLEAHMNTLDLAKQQQLMARTIATNHGMPTGVLKSSNPDLQDDEAAKLKSDWKLSQNTVAVLNASTDFTPLSWDPEKLQLVQARQLTLNELELVFGLPPGWLGGMNSARQYSNIEQDAVNLLKFSLAQHLIQFEQTLSLAFPRGTNVRADLDEVLRADTLTRYQAYAIALDKEFMSVDEVRAEEHRAPLPERPKPELPDAFVSQQGQPGIQPGDGNGSNGNMNSNGGGNQP